MGGGWVGTTIKQTQRELLCSDTKALYRDCHDGHKSIRVIRRTTRAHTHTHPYIHTMNPHR